MDIIFVPTDLSDHSKVALDYALQLSKAFVAKKLIFYHHNPQPISTEIPVMYVEDSEKINTQLHSEMAKILKKHMEKAHVPEQFLETEILVSSLPIGSASDLIETAKKHKAQLIVMGSHGKTGFQKFLFGSVTAEVLERSSIPVLTIPKDYIFKPIERVTFASSLTYFTQEVKTIIEFTQDLFPQIDIVHMDYGLLSAQLVGHAKRQIEKLKNPLVELHIVPAKPEFTLKENLNQWLKTRQPEWLIMFPSRREWYEKLFLSSKSLELAMEFQKPMLIIQKKD